MCPDKLPSEPALIRASSVGDFCCQYAFEIDNAAFDAHGLPEPASLGLSCTGPALIGLGAKLRRRRR